MTDIEIDGISMLSIYNEFCKADALCAQAGLIEAQTIIGSHFHKTLIIAVSSRFEQYIMGQLHSLFCDTCTDVSLQCLYRKMMDRKFFILFPANSENKTIDPFLKYFGDELQQKIRSDIRSSITLSAGEENFMYLIRMRNLLAHLDYATYTLSGTVGDVFNKYISARDFIVYIFEQLHPSKRISIVPGDRNI